MQPISPEYAAAAIPEVVAVLAGIVEQLEECPSWRWLRRRRLDRARRMMQSELATLRYFASLPPSQRPYGPRGLRAA